MHSIVKAAVYYKPLDMKLEEKPIPEINNNELLIKPVAVGVCPTDVRIYYFGSKNIKPPVVLGHEVSGVVLESKVDGFVKGDRVNVAADAPCLKCRECRRGHHNLCQFMTSLGFNIDGAYAEYMRVPRQFIDAGLVFKLPDEVTFEEGALIEPVAVSLHALNLVMPSNKDVVVIIGDGPNALIHLQLLKKYFAVRKIIVVGAVDHRLKKALDLGADETIHVENFKEEMSRVKDIGVDIIDLAIGNENAVNEALSIMGPGTRILFFAGSHTDIPLNLTLNTIHYSQLLITGSSGTNISNYKRAYEIVSNKMIDLRSIISHEYSLNQILDAFETARSWKGLKVLVRP